VFTTLALIRSGFRQFVASGDPFFNTIAQCEAELISSQIFPTLKRATSRGQMDGTNCTKYGVDIGQSSLCNRFVLDSDMMPHSKHRKFAGNYGQN